MEDESCLKSSVDVELQVFLELLSTERRSASMGIGEDRELKMERWRQEKKMGLNTSAPKTATSVPLYSLRNLLRHSRKFKSMPIPSPSILIPIACRIRIVAPRPFPNSVCHLPAVLIPSLPRLWMTSSSTLLKFLTDSRVHPDTRPELPIRDPNPNSNSDFPFG